MEATMTLQLVKQRLNRLPNDATLDTYLQARINAVEQELRRTGIQLDMTNERDTMLVVDVTVWQYQNRDVASAQPEWLKYAIRQRFLQDRQVVENDP